MEEIPKNYSDVYNEDLIAAVPPVPATRGSTTASSIKNHQQQRHNYYDGESQWRRRREFGGGIDLNELLPKLDTISREQQKIYADSALKQHYNDVFSRRSQAAIEPIPSFSYQAGPSKQTKQHQQQPYKVGIEYVEQNGQQLDRYLVKVQRNTLEEVKAKLPIKGNYRLFFSNGDECEEIEDNDEPVPVQKRNNGLYIHCRVFKK